MVKRKITAEKETEVVAQIVSRKQAKAIGMSRYFTGIPCKHGLVAERNVGNSHCQCSLCKEKLHQIKMRYQKKNKAACKERIAQWRKNNGDYFKNWRGANKELSKSGQRAWYENNRERVRESCKKWRKQNPEYERAKLIARRAAKDNRTLRCDEELTAFVELEAVELAYHRERLTGFPWHVDHMIPLRGSSVSGLHHYSNLQVIPAFINMSKGNQLIYTNQLEWLTHAESGGE